MRLDMIRFSGICKSYKKISALRDITFSIPEGSVTGIIGPNGAGKSTLIRILSGFEFQDRGDVRIFGEIMKNFSRRKEFISYMPEKMSLYPELYVSEFLKFFQNTTGASDPDLLNALSLKRVLKKKIGNLSKGWHQRLKLYVSLCNSKPIVVLDEPFDGFDPLQLRDIMGIFRKQNALGRSFVLTIHQLNDAQRMCDYFILLDEGGVISRGSLEDLAKGFSCKDMSLENIFLKALKK